MVQSSVTLLHKQGKGTTPMHILAAFFKTQRDTLKKKKKIKKWSSKGEEYKLEGETKVRMDLFTRSLIIF